MPPRAFDRATMLHRLGRDRSTCWSSAAGSPASACALDAAARGLRTALVERDDFASGTSSKSSKLVHGGLRYLQQGDVRLVYEALAERQRLRRNAPHLVRVLPFLIPILTKDGVVIAEDRPGARLGDVDVRPHRRVAHRQAPPAARQGRGAGPPADDAGGAARLGLPLLRRPGRRRPARASPSPAPRPTTAPSSPTAARVVGHRQGRARARDRGADVDADGERFDVSAAVVVNATGVWADDVRALDEGAASRTRSGRPRASTSPCRGTKVRNDIAVVIPVPEGQAQPVRRAVGRRRTFGTYVGTTDTDYDGPLDDPQCTPDDIDYVLRALNCVASRPAITDDDITGTWAGLRPLVQASRSAERTADLSRRHRVDARPSRRGHASPAASSRPTGGWPPTRSTSSLRPARTDEATLPHEALRAARRRRATRSRAGPARPPPTSPARYGTAAADVEALIDGRSRRSAEPLVPGLPYLRRRGRLRGAPRDGPHARRRPVAGAPGPACSTATPPPRAAPAVAASSARSSAGTTPSRPARSTAYVASIAHECGRASRPTPGRRRS